MKRAAHFHWAMHCNCICVLRFLCVVILLCLAASCCAETEVKKLFILHSYEENHVCGQPQHDGVLASLKEKGLGVGESLHVKTYYMDTKRKNNSHELMEKQAEIALSHISDFSPDVLITIDDNAFRTVALELVDKPLAIIFSGMNGQPEDYNRYTQVVDSWQKPGHNVTGVYEKLYFVEALKVHKKLFPDLDTIIAFVDTSPTGRAIKKQIELEISGKELPCVLEIKTVSSFEEYKKEIVKASKSEGDMAIYPAALLLKDASNTTYTAPDIFDWTIKNSTLPEISLNFSFTRMGLFGGAAVDFYAMGKQAGKMTAAVFKGSEVGSIPIQNAERFALAFNLERAQNLGISLPLDILLAADEIVTPEK